MRTIADAIQTIDESVIKHLSGQAAQALSASDGGDDHSKLLSTCVALVENSGMLPTDPVMRQLAIAMAGLVLGYAIARHEIGEELLGKEEMSDE